MRVLDANFLIDSLNGEAATKAFYEAHGAAEERWVMPVPAYAAALVGVGNTPGADVSTAIDSLAWGQVYAVDAHLAVTAAEIADAIGPQGPYLDGGDGLVAAVGREVDAPVASADGDLTHPVTTATKSDNLT